MKKDSPERQNLLPLIAIHGGMLQGVHEGFKKIMKSLAGIRWISSGIRLKRIGAKNNCLWLSAKYLPSGEIVNSRIQDASAAPSSHGGTPDGSG